MKISRVLRLLGFLIAVLALDAAAGLAQNQADAQRRKADAEIVAGVSLLKKTNRHSQAIAHFNAAIKLQPKYSLAHLWRGDAYEKWGDAAPPNSRLRLSRYETARSSYGDALQYAAPDSIDARDARRKRAAVENKIGQTQPGPALSVYVENQLLSLPLPAAKVEGQIRLPLDAVMTALGARKISYDPLVNTIKYELDGRTVQVQLNVRLVLLTDKSGELINQRRVILERPIVEVRSKGRDYATVESDFFRDALGADVQWDERTRVLRISPMKVEAEKISTIFGNLLRVDVVSPVTVVVSVVGKEQTFTIADAVPIRRKTVKSLDDIGEEELSKAQPDDFAGEITPRDLMPGDKIVLQYSTKRGVIFVGDYHAGRGVKPTPTPEPTPEPSGPQSYVEELEADAHEGAVSTLALSDDGSTVATGGADKTVKLWKIGVGKAVLQRTLQTPAAVGAVAFSPDGQTVAGGSADSTVRLWSVGNGRLLKALSGHLGPIETLAFSPDGDLLAVGARENTSVFPSGEVQVWHIASGRLKQKLPKMQSACTDLTYSKSGLLATAGGRYYIDIWKQQGGTYDYARTFIDLWGRNVAIAFSPDGKYLAAANDDGSLRVWNLANPSPVPLWIIHTTTPLSALDFAPDSQRLVTGNSAGQLRLWSARDGKVLASWPDSPGKISIRAVAIDRAGKVFSAQSDGEFAVWAPRR
jgi:WD40 repeat protein